MNADQVASIGRTLLKVLGGVAASWAVTHGYIDAAQADGFTTALIAAGGGVAVIVGMVFSHRKHKG